MAGRPPAGGLLEELALRRALAHILEHRERVWLTRPRDIYAHVASPPAGVVPGSR